jgi:glycosyltransferase involved in cell wall biosynthesis
VNSIGISILIPVYNRDIRQLAQSLVEQCQVVGVNYEVLCYDDASNPDFKNINRQMSQWDNVTYLELPFNHGRSKIRNRLARDANFPWLLFLDCDSVIVKDNFLSSYLINSDGQSQVIYGGTVYQSQRPSKDYELHWHYGSKVEAENSLGRSKHPFESFKTNNFFIAKGIFDSIKFDESIVNYGYEDVLFANDLQQHHINILHIDNQVLHDGIESNEVYLKKIKQSIANLKKLNSSGRTISTRLSRMADKCVPYPVLLKLSSRLRKVGISLIERLLNRYPLAIFLLQVWKLLNYLDEDLN